MERVFVDDLRHVDIKDIEHISGATAIVREYGSHDPGRVRITLDGYCQGEVSYTLKGERIDTPESPQEFVYKKGREPKKADAPKETYFLLHRVHRDIHLWDIMKLNGYKAESIPAFEHVDGFPEAAAEELVKALNAGIISF